MDILRNRVDSSSEASADDRSGESEMPEMEAMMRVRSKVESTT